MANESAEDLLDLLHRMKIGLTKHSTGRGWDDEEYQRIRKTLLAAPIAAKLPSFVRFCQDLSDFWTFIQPKFPHYHERREFISAEFAPIFDALEQGAISELADMANACRFRPLEALSYPSRGLRIAWVQDKGR